MRVVSALILSAGLILATQVRAGAQPSPLSYAQASDQSQQVGEAYLAAYIARDWAALEPLLAEHGNFADPTAELVFGTVQRRDRADTMRGFREGYAAITQMAFRRERAFFSGHYAVFEGRLDWTLALQDGRHVATQGMPFVVVLRVEQGRVVEHRDLADYHPFVAAHRAAVPAS